MPKEKETPNPNASMFAFMTMNKSDQPDIIQSSPFPLQQKIGTETIIDSFS